MSILSRVFGLHETIVKWIWNGVVVLFMFGALFEFYSYFSGNDSDYEDKLRLSKDGITVMARITSVGDNLLFEGDEAKYADYEFEDATGKKFTGNRPFEPGREIPELTPVIYNGKDPGGTQFAGTQEELKVWLGNYDPSDNLVGGFLTLIMGLLLFYGNQKGVL